MPLDFLILQNCFIRFIMVNGSTHNVGHILNLVFALVLPLNSLCMSDLPSDHNCIFFWQSSSVIFIITEQTAERKWNTTFHVHYQQIKDLLTTFTQLVKDARTSYFFGLTNTSKRNASFLFSTINRLFTPGLCSFPATSSDDCGKFLNCFPGKISGIRSQFKPGTCHSVQVCQPIPFSNVSSISMTDLLDIFSHMHT